VRELAAAERIRGFMRALGAEADVEVAAYFTGGATAVLHWWRASTIDVDIVFVPERDRLLQAIQAIKIDLKINVELACTPDPGG
jgi:hypothetical protein